MIVYIGLTVASGFLTYTAGTWAYLFLIILRQGEVTLYEPNRPWLMAEFSLAVALALLGIFFLIVAVGRLKRRTKRRSRG